MEIGAECYSRFLAGDDEGMTELVAMYADGLILYLLQIVKNIRTAEELAEDTFARLVLKKPRYRDDASFKTWLYTIGRNLALDHLRKSAKVTLLEDAKEASPEGEEESLFEAVVKREDAAAVRAAIRKLPPDYAEVLCLTYFAELSNKETARIMKRSVHAVENLNSRARSALKEILLREGFIYEKL